MLSASHSCWVWRMRSSLATFMSSLVQTRRSAMPHVIFAEALACSSHLQACPCCAGFGSQTITDSLDWISREEHQSVCQGTCMSQYYMSHHWMVSAFVATSDDKQVTCRVACTAPSWKLAKINQIVNYINMYCCLITCALTYRVAHKAGFSLTVWECLQPL